MLDLVSGGRADFGTGESSSEAELGGFLIDPAREARDVGGGPARRVAVHDRDAVHRSRRRRSSPCRRATSCPSRSRSRTRRCGSRAAAARRSTSPRSTASARSRSRSSTPKRRSTGSTDYYDDARDGVRADRRRGEPERRVRHHVHVPRRRGRRDRARARGCQLLRVLARALLRVRPPSARAAPTCGPSTARNAPSRATRRRRSRRR